jgi:Zn-dependent M28 family amino/carboxypeptidase
MRPRLLPSAVALLAFALPIAQPALAQGVQVEALRRHVDVLASDAYEGRKPGTLGETKTIGYIASQFAALGLEPGAGNGSWYQPVRLASRRAGATRAAFAVNRRPVELGANDIVLVSARGVSRLADAPVWFVGRGGAEPLAGADLRGAVVLMLFDPASTDMETRIAALGRAGAAAVVQVLGNDIPWASVRGTISGGREQLQRAGDVDIQGAMPRAAAARLVNASQFTAADQPGFRAVRLPARATLDVTSQVNAYTSYNVIGRLKGRGTTGESVLLLGHWDHLGICRPEGIADRICNGAVDNASGIAVLIETARGLARGQRPERDILFMATTAEEMGLLGAEHFTANPVVPLRSIVGAINIDTIAIAPRGEPVAIVGRGTTPLDPLVDEAARELGRKIDSDIEGNGFIQRQDGWAFTRVGVPAIMTGGSFSSLAKLGTFLSGAYHKPEDDLKRPIELGGAAEDTDLLILLSRKLADPKRYRPAAR